MFVWRGRDGRREIRVLKYEEGRTYPTTRASWCLKLGGEAA
jgi:hypothetical protein